MKEIHWRSWKTFLWSGVHLPIGQAAHIRTASLIDLFPHSGAKIDLFPHSGAKSSNRTISPKGVKILAFVNYFYSYIAQSYPPRPFEIHSMNNKKLHCNYEATTNEQNGTHSLNEERKYEIITVGNLENINLTQFNSRTTLLNALRYLKLLFKIAGKL